MGLGWLQSPPHHTHTHTHTHTHFPTQSETDWLLGVPFVATGRSKKPAVDRKERVCLHLGLILGWDPLQETLRRSWGTGLQSECAGESPGVGGGSVIPKLDQMQGVAKGLGIWEAELTPRR